MNPYVEKVDERQMQITYSEDFKRRFIKEYTAGKSSKEIFSDAGFDIEMIGYKRIEGATRRWRENRKLTGYGRGEFTEEEIKAMLKMGAESGTVEDSEREMINSVFSFGDKSARELMVPRREVFAVDIEDPDEEILDAVLESRHSRIQV